MSIVMPTIVGALACQKNSFMKTLKTVVYSCKEYTEPIASSKDKQNKKIEPPKEKLYAVEFEDTILFPEGGGQPCDAGSILLSDETTIPVKQVLRQGLNAVHVTPQPVEVGSEVTLKVDWDRRIDIMQQHTGQHLISAVFDTYDLETLSWSMGDMINYLELPRKVEDSELEEVKRKVDEIVLQALPILVTTPDEHGKEIDTSHIPDDYDLSKGIIRIVKIGDLDANPCCGTHLTSTAQVQAVTFLHQTNIRGGNSRLHFVCGSRVAKLASSYHSILKDVLGSQLSCQISEVLQKVSELYSNYKKLQSRESALLKQLANIRAVEVFNQFKNNEGDLAVEYRADNAPEYFTIFQKEILSVINANKDSGVNLTDKFTIVLINGDYKSRAGGMVKIMGPRAEEVLGQLKKILSNMKGGGKGASFQGKIPEYVKGELESALRYLELVQQQ